jgi:hypothetical protein
MAIGLFKKYHRVFTDANEKARLAIVNAVKEKRRLAREEAENQSLEYRAGEINFMSAQMEQLRVELRKVTAQAILDRGEL